MQPPSTVMNRKRYRRIFNMELGKYNAKIKHYNKYNIISKKILTKANVVKDTFSQSTPYITISLGNNTSNIIKEKQSLHNNTNTVDWYEHYDIPSQIPVNGILIISVYDNNKHQSTNMHYRCQNGIERVVNV